MLSSSKISSDILPRKFYLWTPLILGGNTLSHSIGAKFVCISTIIQLEICSRGSFIGPMTGSLGAGCDFSAQKNGSPRLGKAICHCVMLLGLCPASNSINAWTGSYKNASALRRCQIAWNAHRWSSLPRVIDCVVCSWNLYVWYVAKKNVRPVD